MKRKVKREKEKPVRSVDLIVSTMESLITTIGCSCCSARWFRKDKEKVVPLLREKNFSDLNKLVVRFQPEYMRSPFSKRKELHVKYCFQYLGKGEITTIWAAETSKNSVQVALIVGN